MREPARQIANLGARMTRLHCFSPARMELTMKVQYEKRSSMTLYAAWKMGHDGAARRQISAIKVVAANMVMDVLDRAIQIHGARGTTDGTPLAAIWRFSRSLRLADGPDEVHKMVLARRELHRWAKRDEAAAAGELEPRHATRTV
jgi:alkylation response protein AidB-like acyl-CoA dehydrogenase